MPKRFTDTEIWKKQRWFKNLSPSNKLAFIYIKDMCNHAGIWKIDCSDLLEDTGLSEFNLTNFINAVNLDFDGISGAKINRERIVIVQKTYLLITGFMQFQYEKGDKTIPINNITKSALNILKHKKILDEGLSKGWVTLSQG